MVDMIKDQMDQNEDTVRFYHLCRSCTPAVQIMGTDPMVITELEDIII